MLSTPAFSNGTHATSWRLGSTCLELQAHRMQGKVQTSSVCSAMMSFALHAPCPPADRHLWRAATPNANIARMSPPRKTLYVIRNIWARQLSIRRTK